MSRSTYSARGPRGGRWWVRQGELAGQARQVAAGMHAEAVADHHEAVAGAAVETETAVRPGKCPRCGHEFRDGVPCRHYAIGRVECPGGRLNEIRYGPGGAE